MEDEVIPLNVSILVGSVNWQCNVVIHEDSEVETIERALDKAVEKTVNKVKEELRNG